ncbi:hypothetical protein M0804_005243 [Polistes exclamans]|nr:hypothetical protein M0804_005243 [Polistes exclamans]
MMVVASTNLLLTDVRIEMYMLLVVVDVVVVVVIAVVIAVLVYLLLLIERVTPRNAGTAANAREHQTPIFPVRQHGKGGKREVNNLRHGFVLAHRAASCNGKSRRWKKEVVEEVEEDEEEEEEQQQQQQQQHK